MSGKQHSQEAAMAIIARIAGNGPESTQSHQWVRNGEHAVNGQGVRVALVDLRAQAATTCTCCK